MSSNPLVSICIPCHNGGQYIAEAIDSVLAQSWSNIEIIAVDDASSDNSLQVLNGYRRMGVCVISESFGSAAKARNHALQHAQGELVKFLDCDDLLNPAAIECQVYSLGHSTTAISFSAWGRFYNDDLTTFRLNRQPVWRDMPSVDWLVEAWRDAQPMTQPGMYLIPRHLLQRSGGWDDQLTLIDDFEFFARVLCHAVEVRFTSGACLYYRSGLSGSLSQQKTRQAYESAYHSLIKGTGHLLEKRSDQEAKRSCANLFQNFIYDAYPLHLDLIRSMQSRIDALGGSDLLMPAGPRMAFLSRLLGWRNAKRLRSLISGN